MICDNNTATAKELSEKLDKEWKEHWKDNPPKYEGKILIGGDEEGFNVFSSISPAMYPYIINSMRKANPEAFSEAMSIMNMANVAASFAEFLLDLTKSFDDDSEEADDDESDSDSEDDEDKTPE